jgi:acetyl-CoA carboxylase carboxyl transferase subunit alpha
LKQYIWYLALYELLKFNFLRRYKLNKKEEVKELENKVKELENLSKDKTLDVEEDLKKTKTKLKELKKTTKKELTAWDRVNIARSPKRPTALDYIDLIFDDFLELHGDRQCSDDKAIVCRACKHRLTKFYNYRRTKR